MSESDKWLRVFRQAPEGVRLFCFPHAGGSASYYYPWSKLLPDDIQMQVLQYPGRQDRSNEPFVRTIPDLADRIHAAIRPQLTQPYAFFGHSMGAILAFEVACRIARKGGPGPAHLFASGRRAPSRTRHEELHRASRDGFIAEMRVVGGTDLRVLADDDLLNFVLPTVRADYRAIETYRFDSAEPLPCDITAMVGDSDPRVDVQEAAAWAQHTHGNFDLRTYPGGHFYLDEHRADVLDVISNVLFSARQNAARA